MKQNNKKYAFNFSIPIGEKGKIGPTGPQGMQGPTGPTTLENVIFIQYYNSDSNGLLTIFDTTILPQNSKIFHVTNQEIIIDEPGNYEFTFCGKINGNANLDLQTTDANNTLSTLFSLKCNIKTMLFSKTKILQVKSKQRIHILFITNDPVGNAETLKLLIKRLPF